MTTGVDGVVVPTKYCSACFRDALASENVCSCGCMEFIPKEKEEPAPLTDFTKTTHITVSPIGVMGAGPAS